MATKKKKAEAEAKPQQTEEPGTKPRSDARMFVLSPNALGILHKQMTLVYKPDMVDEDADVVDSVRMCTQFGDFSQDMRPGDLLVVPKPLGKNLVEQPHWAVANNK